MFVKLGQQDDARMNLAVALTASRHGATVVNHVSVKNLIKGLDKVLYIFFDLKLACK